MSEDAPRTDIGPNGEPLYTDEHGVPLLFDVVLPGDYLKATGISLVDETAGRRGHPADLERRIRAAIDAALPKVTERTAAAMREALLKEVHDKLREAENQPR
jgi:hypothetical protein